MNKAKGGRPETPLRSLMRYEADDAKDLTFVFNYYYYINFKIR